LTQRGLNTCMRIQEVIKPTRPQTPEQQRVAALQQRVDTAKQAVKAERQRQKVQRAQQQLVRARAVT
jgi:hypothetical protein